MEHDMLIKPSMPSLVSLKRFGSKRTFWRCTLRLWKPLRNSLGSLVAKKRIKNNRCIYAQSMARPQFCTRAAHRRASSLKTASLPFFFFLSSLVAR